MNRANEMFPVIIGLVAITALWWLIVFLAVWMHFFEKLSWESVVDDVIDYMTNPREFGQDLIRDFNLGRNRKTT